MTTPIQLADDAARALAHRLMADARFAALAVLQEDGTPLVTRIAFGLDPQQQPVSLISELALHTAALHRQPACSLLVGEPGARGDPLSHPRLSLMALAEFIPRQGAGHEALAAHYLRRQPKARLYLQLADFGFVRFAVTAAHLNGGFGKAFRLAGADLAPPG